MGEGLLVLACPPVWRELVICSLKPEGGGAAPRYQTLPGPSCPQPSRIHLLEPSLCALTHSYIQEVSLDKVLAACGTQDRDPGCWC